MVDDQVPLSPIYAFNDPREPITLFEGAIGGLGEVDATGKIELSLSPRIGLRWSVDPGSNSTAQANRPVELQLHRPEGVFRLSGWAQGWDEGWLNGAAFGNDDSPIERIIGHWFNLPLRNNSKRWRFECEDWAIIIDTRPDHREVWQDLNKSDMFIMTHVMELRRTDGGTFTPKQAQPIIDALHVGISFALGRWAAPMLIVGQGPGDTNLWEEWLPRHCDPARSISSGWWYDQDLESLEELLRNVIPAFYDQEMAHHLKFQMTSAIIATNDKGFVEQRITMGSSGLEHITWIKLVSEKGLTEDQYLGKASYHGKRLNAATRLRMVLSEAMVSTDIDQAVLPVTSRFRTDESSRQSNPDLDAADIVTYVRNRLMHPDERTKRIYEYDGLLTEVWGLTRHYLVLLILNSLGYNGHYRSLHYFRGYAYEVLEVPWKWHDPPA
ncbi:hypothetical protein [Glycomyces salinus]|uniref:hypothetical protein n=1 Tax=Glycomyces salinus TaxID=980294 RepID=UPI0018EBC24E|nr:hypothetical protein [Glycomyces salinus]